MRLCDLPDVGEGGGEVHDKSPAKKRGACECCHLEKLCSLE